MGRSARGRRVEAATGWLMVGALPALPGRRQRGVYSEREPLSPVLPSQDLREPLLPFDLLRALHAAEGAGVAGPVRGRDVEVDGLVLVEVRPDLDLVITAVRRSEGNLREAAPLGARPGFDQLDPLIIRDVQGDGDGGALLVAWLGGAVHRDLGRVPVELGELSLQALAGLLEPLGVTLVRPDLVESPQSFERALGPLRLGGGGQRLVHLIVGALLGADPLQALVEARMVFPAGPQVL